MKYKAKEAEVKQNLHSIQLAVERYAVDHAGSYPSYLYGGDELFNIGTINYYHPHGWTGAGYWNKPIHLPFDLEWIAQAGGDYADNTWEIIEDDVARYREANSAEMLAARANGAIGDPLQAEGYMPRFPRNPFVRSNKNAFSLAALKSKDSRYAGYGGVDGCDMWNLGCFGELPQLILDADGTSEPRLDFPGQFYYHPRWADGATNTGHLAAAQSDNPGSWIPRDIDPAVAPPLSDAAEVASEIVGGYDLLAFGSPKTKGQDLDVSVAGHGTAHFFRTGYLTLGQERNPWIVHDVYALPDGQSAPVGDYDERPYSDGLPDFLIIHLGAGKP